MSPWLITILEFALIIFVIWACRRDAFKSGYEKGLAEQEKVGKECYERGRFDESRWWIAAELDINEERLSMWKREHGR